MRTSNKYERVILIALGLIVSMAPSAHAHLMVAQHGTLNIVDDGAFMVLSLPMSAFGDIDEDNDGLVSMVEFNHHRATIVESVRKNVRLSDREKNLSLQGIMLSPVISYDSPTEPISQLTVMGRFTLNDPDSALRFQVDLFGKQSIEQLLEITATRKVGGQKHEFELTPEAPASPVLPESAIPKITP